MPIHCTHVCCLHWAFRRAILHCNRKLFTTSTNGIYGTFSSCPTSATYRKPKQQKRNYLQARLLIMKRANRGAPPSEEHNDFEKQANLQNVGPRVYPRRATNSTVGDPVEFGQLQSMSMSGKLVSITHRQHLELIELKKTNALLRQQLERRKHELPSREQLQSKPQQQQAKQMRHQRQQQRKRQPQKGHGRWNRMPNKNQLKKALVTALKIALPLSEGAEGSSSTSAPAAMPWTMPVMAQPSVAPPIVGMSNYAAYQPVPTPGYWYPLQWIE